MRSSLSRLLPEPRSVVEEARLPADTERSSGLKSGAYDWGSSTGIVRLARKALRRKVCSDEKILLYNKRTMEHLGRKRELHLFTAPDSRSQAQLADEGM